MEALFTTWWFYALLSAVFAALTAIFAKLGVETVSSNLATAIRTVVILAIAWGIVFFRGETPGLTTLSQRSLIFLVLSGMTTGLSWIFYFRALQLGQASWVAPIDKLSLVLVIVFAALFLHEPLNFASILGGALIVAGVLVLTVYKA